MLEFVHFITSCPIHKVMSAIFDFILRTKCFLSSSWLLPTGYPSQKKVNLRKAEGKSIGRLSEKDWINFCCSWNIISLYKSIKTIISCYCKRYILRWYISLKNRKFILYLALSRSGNDLLLKNLLFKLW